MYAHPGKKLLFMGSEFGQFIEWDYKKPLDWFLLEHERHRQMQQYVKALNAFYTGCPALYQIEDSWSGFTWLNAENAMQSSMSFLRRGIKQGKSCVCAFNFTPVPVEHFLIGLPGKGTLQETFSSDNVLFGGNGRHHTLTITTSHLEFAGQPYRAVIDLPPLSAVYFDYDEEESIIT
jgi:1,4-alpha-glucan branching enzyme